MEHECDSDTSCNWCLVHGLENLNKWVVIIQITPLLRSAECWEEFWRLKETSCHSDFCEKTSANIVAKMFQKRKIIRGSLSFSLLYLSLSLSLSLSLFNQWSSTHLLCSLKVVVSMHQVCLQCWQVPFFLFLMYPVSLLHFLNVMPYHCHEISCSLIHLLKFFAGQL